MAVLQRPNASAHAAILGTAWELAREVGHARLTVEAIVADTRRHLDLALAGMTVRHSR